MICARCNADATVGADIGIVSVRASVMSARICANCNEGIIVEWALYSRVVYYLTECYNVPRLTAGVDLFRLHSRQMS